MDKQKLFVLITNHHGVIEKKIIENKKIGVRFSIGDPSTKPAKQKKQETLEKSLSLHICGGLSAAAV